MGEQQQSPRPTERRAEQQAQPIDLRALAERVYRLMLEDLRLEQARSGRSATRRGAAR
jgi:hypothetical protein